MQLYAYAVHCGNINFTSAGNLNLTSTSSININGTGNLNITSGGIIISSTTASTSTTTGAIQVAGGIGVQGSIYTTGVYCGNTSFTNMGDLTITNYSNLNVTLGSVLSGGNLSAGYSSTNYINILGVSTGTSPIIEASGTDTNVGLRLNVQGTGKSVDIGINNTSTNVNYISVFGNTTGNSPTITANGRWYKYKSNTCNNWIWWSNNFIYNSKY